MAAVLIAHRRRREASRMRRLTIEALGECSPGIVSWSTANGVERGRSMGAMLAARRSARLRQLQEGDLREVDANDAARWRLRLRRAYNAPRTQWCVAALIIANFLYTIAEKQWNPRRRDGSLTRLFRSTSDFFNVAFLLELLVNIAAHGRAFVRSGWNWFDVLVVSVGLLFLLRIALPPWANFVRVLRTFRVFRLFKRVPALGKILTAIVRAIPGMASAGVVMLLVMCIYAVLGVEFFADHGADEGAGAPFALPGWSPKVVMADGAAAPGEASYGDEYFGTFDRALFTMFQVGACTHADGVPHCMLMARLIAC